MSAFERLLDPDSPLAQSMFFLARRFVAGESPSQAVAIARELNASGMSATLDFLGESVTVRADAERTRAAYIELIDLMRSSGVRANCSLKLSAIGLAIDESYAYENLCAILDAATSLEDTFVRIDMEGSGTVDATLRTFERAYRAGATVGPVLQAYLKRTPQDLQRAIELGARVRLCKGAYDEPPLLAYRDMPTIQREYLRLAEALLDRGTYPGIATHDERLIRAVRVHAAERGIANDRFEFQLLYGVRPDVQRALVADGYRVRVYVPYGTHWARYFYRRIAERKENALFALRSVVAS